MIAPPLFDKLGRKFVMYAAAWTFILGAVLQAAAVNMIMLQIPRLVAGVGIGALSMCSPVYM
jgi:MFS family permease